MTIAKLQNHVLAPQEPVDYSNIVLNSYPKHAVQSEPFVGFKVLCRDTNAFTVPGNVRMPQIDQSLGILYNTGCILRETSMEMRDGIWVITMPNPRSQLRHQLDNLMNVLTLLDHNLGIVPNGMVEICVSGRCTPGEVENCLQRLVIPHPYVNMLLVPDNAPYRYGYIIRINDEYMCFRTRWNIGMSADTRTPQGTFEHLMLLSQLLCSMYH